MFKQKKKKVSIRKEGLARGKHFKGKKIVLHGIDEYNGANYLIKKFSMLNYKTT